MHTYSLAEYEKSIDCGDWQGVADLMLSSANKLAKAGAGFLICPDNTIHQAFPLVEPQSPLPWLHIAEVVAAEAVQRVGWSRAKSTRRSSPRAASIICAPGAPNAKKSIASSWMSWCTESSGPRRSRPFNASSDA
jgi:hypothetical protein